MSTAIEQRAAALEASAVIWDSLADEQDRIAAGGNPHDPADVCANKATMFRRTAEAQRLQIRTGAAHCACCLKPLGGH
jgi:hypothetical protein